MSDAKPFTAEERAYLLDVDAHRLGVARHRPVTLLERYDSRYEATLAQVASAHAKTNTAYGTLLLELGEALRQRDAWKTIAKWYTGGADPAGMGEYAREVYKKHKDDPALVALFNAWDFLAQNEEDS